jgi:hypothetical protein
LVPVKVVVVLLEEVHEQLVDVAQADLARRHADHRTQQKVEVLASATLLKRGIY